MSSIIYIKNDGDDLNAGQLAFLHKFSDQARVWAYLLFKEAILSTRDAWISKRDEWLQLKDRLRSLDAPYAEAVFKALQQPYIDSQGETKHATSRSATHASIPPHTSPDPQKTTEIQNLVKEIQGLTANLYPAASEVGFGFKGPFLGDADIAELLRSPASIEELKEYIAKFGLDPSKTSGESGIPPQDMAAGRARNKKLADPEQFAIEALQRAIGYQQGKDQPAGSASSVYAYNPYKADDIGVERAKFGTFLRTIMDTMVTDYFNKVKKTKSLSTPVGTDEGHMTLEDQLPAQIEADTDFDFSDPKLVQGFEKYIEGELARGKWPKASADRFRRIYKMRFIDAESLSDIARKENMMARNRKNELKNMASVGINIQSLSQNTGPSKAEDEAMRDQIWDASIAAEQDPSKKEAITNAREASKVPDASRVSDIIYASHPKHSGPYIFEYLLRFPEVQEAWDAMMVKKKLRKKQALEALLESISILRKEGSLNYNLLRNKIEQRLTAESSQLFSVYSYLYESDYSNPDTARIMKLSPPRITGLKKKIISILLDLPEIDNLLHEAENGSISPLRRLIYKEGDSVKVNSINEIGVISSVCGDNWYDIHLDNGNVVFAPKEDIQKYCTLIDSANNVISDYFGKEVLTPQCYLSLIGSKLVILELRPTSETATTVRLHVNNDLVDMTEISEGYPDNLLSLLKGHIGVTASIDTPFTTMFEEVD